MSDTAGIREAFGSDFEILRELGRGGVSVVYLAHDRVLGRNVAVKLIDDRYVGDAEALARFQREARILAQLHHPNIVPIHSAKRLADGRTALVMQHMAGPTLRDHLRREGRLPVDRVEQVLRDLAGALGYLHRRGIVHRDVKPENVYLDTDTGHAFLSDFGIAKPTDGDNGLTLAGVVLGTPTYMSPEQIDGAWLNGQSDLYSLGLVGWEMLTGSRPWAGEALYTIIYKQKNEHLPSLRELRPDVPEHLREAVERALFKDRALRWASADDLLHQLRGPALPVLLPAKAAAGAVVLADPHDDIPTQVIRAGDLAGEVWRVTTTAVQLRTARRRKRSAVVVVAAALTLGGMTAAAALFAKMRDEGSDLSTFAAPAEQRAAPPPRAEPSASAAPPATAPAAPPVLPAAAPVEAPRAEREPRPAPRRQPRSSTRSRTPVRSRPQTEAAPAPQDPPAPRPRLLGTPVNERVETRPARGTREPGIDRSRVLIPRER
jgi:hypothetical protein